MKNYSYSISRAYFNTLAERKDMKGYIIGYLSVNEVINYLNKVAGFNRPITALDIH
jgi:hypothetical protein